jgi:hypothetical protein
MARAFPGGMSAQSPRPSEAPRGDPLVPLLRVEDALGDPDALATWHSALSGALAPDVPHDLLALWLYPAHGGAILLGPEALAADDLRAPVPAPQLAPGQIRLLEDIVHDAGYGSVLALPIRSGRRDVGLILAADLRADRYDDATDVTLEIVAQRLAPMLGRMARQWSETAGGTSHAGRMAALVDVIAHAARHAGSVHVYLGELSRALETILPHDQLELLVEDIDRHRVYRLAEDVSGVLWADPSLELAREDLDLPALLGEGDTLLIADTYHRPGWPRGYFTVVEPAGAELRAAIVVRLPDSDGRRDGGAVYLLAGSIGAELFDDDDLALLQRVAGLVAAQVGTLVARAVPAPPPPAEPSGPTVLAAAELLATGAEFAETTRRVADLAGRILPFDELRFAIRLSEGDRVVLLEPGERRALPDLPLIPVAGTTLAAVLQGELPHSFQLVEGEARLVVPLRVQGRIHGALVLTARPPAILREVHLGPAQQLADVVAAHLELLRRTALLPPPYLPGWKKVR